MIKFFRKVRQRMLNENKLTKYLLYAVGEIILVVIGILIALKVNNYNQVKIIKEKEQAYLVQLKNEFIDIRNSLSKTIERNKNVYTTAKEVVGILNNEISITDEKLLSEKLINMLMYTVKFDSKLVVLSEMKNSGSLNIISNNELRNQLIIWDNLESKMEIYHQTINKEWNSLIDMVRTDGDIKRVWDDTNLSENLYGLSKSNITSSSSNIDLVTSKPFKNSLLLFISVSYLTELDWYKPTLERINNILKLIEREITKG